jgi:hypothetical protein
VKVQCTRYLALIGHHHSNVLQVLKTRKQLHNCLNLSPQWLGGWQTARDYRSARVHQLISPCIRMSMVIRKSLRMSEDLWQTE